MPKEPVLLAHQQWLGYLQPVGLVVSPPALVTAGAVIQTNNAVQHARFLEHLHDVPIGGSEPAPAIRDLKSLVTDSLLFDWKPTDLVPATDPRAAALEVVLTSYNETLRPTYAVPDGDGWLLLIQELPLATDLDLIADDAKHWEASPQKKFERLLRETGVSIGLLVNGTDVRLVYNPPVDNPGHITFPVAAMRETAGRPILAALIMLLGADRLFTLPDKQRLPALLAASRKYQNEVSTELAEQVLAALFELLRGFQAADDQRKGELLHAFLADETGREQVYAGLVTVLMRLVFLLYAEDRGLLSDEEVYIKHYSVTGLFERLREDAGRYPDTMDHRYGAWAQLVALFRLVHDGGGHGKFRLPQRHGHLFEPDRFPFLEGRPRNHCREPREKIAPPLVADGVIFRVLTNLLIVDGERLSYAHLDVEHIGSVYESIMGYRLESAGGRSIALKPKKAHGAPITVNLEALLALNPADRGKWLAEQADQKIDGKPLAALKAADSVEGLVAALEKRVARALTPNIVPPGGMVFQPSDERRRSGSHYTPRTLTGPIFRKALEPILRQLGSNPMPEQILALKVCDLAMGSGAFLVEACRQLGDALLKAWTAHGTIPKIPDDETPELFAQRTIAQRCLYGVDKNAMAVDLAKLSLWLATLARNHPFTFLDHSLRCGDSLVGLTARQIRTFHWNPAEKEQMMAGQEKLRERIEAATRYRQRIIDADEWSPQLQKEENLRLANDSLDLVRFAGNLAVAAFFSAAKDKKRLENRGIWSGLFGEYLSTGLHRPNKEEATLREGPHPVTPFHWEIEFPEVFCGAVAGFDAIVGNPPFLGGTLIGGHLSLAFHDYLVEVYPPASGLADIIAFFLRRSFDLLRTGGSFGLIATNTVAQGDTRSAGLESIVRQGGTIYEAQRRYLWAGEAAVVTSVLHVAKSVSPVRAFLDGVIVDRISSFLLKGGADDMPVALHSNKGRSYLGTKIWGSGFVFEEEHSDGSSSLTDMERLVVADPRNREVLFPYMGGEEFNSSPTQTSRRFVIDFGEMTQAEARQWPLLFSIVEEKVRPIRAGNKQRNYRENWWLHANRVREAGPYLQQNGRLLALTSVSRHLSVAFAQSDTILANSMVLLLLHEDADFAVVQSRVHETWARFVGSSMKDDLRYTTPCFDTFPRPIGHDRNILNEAGKAYYDHRANLMVRNNEGLTETYNRFHDPHESSAGIAKLRELHAVMDRAVLDAYGGDLANLTVPPCEFLLDYDDSEDEDAAESAPGARQKKKPWRYRWPDAFRDEVLALLLELNKERAEMERLAGPAEKVKSSPRKPPKAGDRKAPKKAKPDPNLF